MIEKCKPSADIQELCKWGNSRIMEETEKFSPKKKIFKGIALPVCISPGSICGYFSPLAEESRKLQEGEVAKIELGVNIDGFPALLAHTIIVGKSDDEKKHDLLSSCY